jgi:hypothetical protein
MINSEKPTWVEETSAILKKEKEILSKLEKEIEQKNNGLLRLKEYINALEKILEFNNQDRIINANGHGSFDPEKLMKQSVKQSMIDIASANNGLLVASEAVNILINAKVFSDRDHARNAIYSNITHHRKYFEKERPGIYRVKNINDVELKLPV